MNKQVLKVSENAEKEEIWFLEHDMVLLQVAPLLKNMIKTG